MTTNAPIVDCRTDAAADGHSPASRGSALRGLMTSNTPEWSTPQATYDEWNARYHFTLDPCSTHENAKCAKHYTKAENGLAQDWASIAPERMPAKIIRRIIVIDRETEVREVVMYDTDSLRDARRKLRRVLTTTATRP
jgi:hypothetical protein